MTDESAVEIAVSHLPRDVSVFVSEKVDWLDDIYGFSRGMQILRLGQGMSLETG